MKNKSFGFWIGLLAIVSGTFIVWMPNGFGQIPPTKLVRQNAAPPNPLRADQPIAIPGKIKQTALQEDDQQFPSLANGDQFPAAPTQQTPFDTAEAFAAPVPESAVPESTTASPLSNAHPFAQQQPGAAVPSNVLSSGQQPAEQSSSFGDFGESPRTAALNRSMPVQQPSGEGTGVPGASSLEGLQTPHLTIQKVLPDEVVIEQPATLKTVIQNAGRSVAKNVTITDRIPQGTRLLSTIPEADVSPNGELRWSVGNLDPNAQWIIEMKVLPLREGEIGSVASVSYTGEASGRITVTRPMLKVDVKAPAEVKLGEVAQVEITVSNPGTATATNIVLVEHVPEGLYHSGGRTISNSIVTALKPKETKTFTLLLTCTGAGNLVNHVVVTADGNLMVEDKTTIRALAPVLDLDIIGARNRFLERQSDYRLIVANKGNASAYTVALELVLPEAVQFVSTNQNGMYDAATRTVHWALDELPAQEAGEIELIIMPAQKGEHSLRFTGTGENNLKAEAVLPVSIDGIPAISFEIVGDSNLVELGKDVTYEIRVVNRGTKAADNVKVRATLADGMAFGKAEGGRFQANGGTIQFETIPQLAPKSENVYRISARSQVEGDHRITVQIISDDLHSPITKEESTRVFR